eukprot:5193791-Karenia_brevis.AAC.1
MHGSESKRRRAGQAMANLFRLMRQWVPVQRILVLAAIVTEDGSHVKDASGIVGALSLSQHWCSVFAKTDVDDADITRYLENLPCRSEWLEAIKQLDMATPELFWKIMQELDDSAPGPDTLIYS